MKIVNLKRFSMFVIGVILMIILFIAILDTKSLSRTEINYMEFTVSSNDTLWKIANIVKEMEKQEETIIENKQIFAYVNGEEIIVEK
mgnify:CR=1 FL=1